MKVRSIGSDPSVPYQKMYVTLFRAITTALDMMEDGEVIKARILLIQAQRATEELYIEGNG